MIEPDWQLIEDVTAQVRNKKESIGFSKLDVGGPDFYFVWSNNRTLYLHAHIHNKYYYLEVEVSRGFKHQDHRPEFVWIIDFNHGLHANSWLTC